MLADNLTAGVTWPAAPEIPERPPWMADAGCLEHPELDFVPLERTDGATPDNSAAIEVCASCLVRLECGSYALADPGLVGIWGGLSTIERRAARRAVDAATPPLPPPPRKRKRRPRRLVVEDEWWVTRPA